MTEKSKFELEIEAFRKNFDSLKEKKIVIYGIGRRTATLLEGIQDYHIIGLMDRDEMNLGRRIFDIPVVSAAYAQDNAELIVINSDPSNYEIIYNRIQDIGIPVYYADGREAHLIRENLSYMDNEYWNIDFECLIKEIKRHDIISFDFFDTLVMRKVISAQDVFRIIENELRKEGLLIDFVALRQSAVSGITNREASYDDIYDRLQMISGLSTEQIQHIKHMELCTEQKLCAVRNDMFSALRLAIEAGKEVFIISDMYLPEKFYTDILEHNGIDISRIHLLLSWEHNATKKDSGLWNIYYTQYIAGRDRPALHIGDNWQTDILNARAYHIDTFYVMSGMEMLRNSSIAELSSRAMTLSASCALGCVISRLFNSPFSLSHTKGKVKISEESDFGYSVYGALIADFLIWLYQKNTENKYDRIIFFSRDGYFLQKDYQYLLEMLGDALQETRYLYISRRIACLANIHDENSFKEFVRFPYVGKFRDYMLSRFNVKVNETSHEYNERMINSFAEYDMLLEWMQPYMLNIRKEIKQQKEWYFNYLAKEGFLNLSLKDAVVDVGYQGTTQFYYQKVINKKVAGLYILAHLEEDNDYLKSCEIAGCYQDKNDPRRTNSEVEKKRHFLDSFLSAPYAMIRYVDRDGNRVCEADKKNQINFQIKEQTNEGIRQYLKDYLRIQAIEEKPDLQFAGYLFSELLSGSAEVEDKILEGFYFDNDMIGTKEVRMEVGGAELTCSVIRFISADTRNGACA